jgi:hypothetical protein
MVVANRYRSGKWQHSISAVYVANLISMALICGGYCETIIICNNIIYVWWLVYVLTKKNILHGNFKFSIFGIIKYVTSLTFTTL